MHPPNETRYYLHATSILEQRFINFYSLQDLEAELNKVKLELEKIKEKYDAACLTKVQNMIKIEMTLFESG